MAIRYFVLFVMAIVVTGCSSTQKGPEVYFSEMICKWAEDGEACRSKLDIRITPLETTITPSKGKSIGKEIMILAFPIEIANQSQTTVKFTISHEWYGGIWPPTDLCACVFPSMLPLPRELSRWPRIERVFQVGERIGQRRELAKRATILKPGQSVTLNLRMDWPGTGSRPMWSPLMDKKTSRTYRIVILLVFEADGEEQYVESSEMQIHVRGMNEAVKER